MNQHSLLAEMEITEGNCEEMTQTLNLLLADEFVIYAATRECHWNVAGPEYDRLSTLFEEQYRQLEDWTRQLATRSCQIGGGPGGGWAELIKGTRLAPLHGAELPAGAMVAGLLALHEAMVWQLRTDVATCANIHRDAGVVNFLTDLMQIHQKAAWQLRTPGNAGEESTRHDAPDSSRSGGWSQPHSPGLAHARQNAAKLQTRNAYAKPAELDWTQF